MQPALRFTQAADLASIRERLAVRFGRIRIEERPDPVSQFVGSFLGSRTYNQISWRVFVRLVERYPSWDALADAPVADIEVAIEGVTFSEKKAPELKQALLTIRERFGRIDLDFLAHHGVDQALICLEHIHGVGRKIAAATLNFSSLRARAFVVDTHVLRVLRRFGLVGIRGDTKAAYDAVMASADDLDADDLFELHWHIKSLGQTVCTHAHTMCASCPLSDICMRRVEDLETLRSFVDRPKFEGTFARTPLGHGAADLCLRGGVQHGALHEVFAVIGHEAAATGFVTGLAARMAADKHLLWIRQDFSALEFGELSATGLLELGVNPERMVLFHAANASDGLRAANDALSCAALSAVIIEVPGSPKTLDLVASRRLTLACMQKSVTAFILRFGAQPDASTAETRWLVRAAASHATPEDWGYPAFETSLIRNRHGKTGDWVMEWNCDDGLFQKPTADIGPVVSASSH